MDDTRLRIQKVLCAQLETVTVANGYQHNLVGNVYRGRTGFGSSDPLPLVTLLERPAFDDDFIVAGEAPTKEQHWELVLQGFAEPDADNPTDTAYPLMADCKKALAAIDPTRNMTGPLRGLAHGLTIFPGVVLPPDPQAHEHTVQFLLQLRVKLVDKPHEPY